MESETDGAFVGSVLLLVIALVVCFSAGCPRRRCSMKSKYALRFLALGYLLLLLGIPVVLVFFNAFQDGVGAAWDAVSTPEAQHAFYLTGVMVAVAVPLNTIFGILCALAIVRQRFRGRALLNAMVDLPFAVSPVVVGLALLLVYGRVDGWVVSGRRTGIQIIFSVPGMILATMFVSLPCGARDHPGLANRTDREQAAALWGGRSDFSASPAAIPGAGLLRVLTTARALWFRRVSVYQSSCRRRDGHVAVGGSIRASTRPLLCCFRRLRSVAGHAPRHERHQPRKPRRRRLTRAIGLQRFGEFVALAECHSNPRRLANCVAGPSGGGSRPCCRDAGLETPTAAMC